MRHSITPEKINLIKKAIGEARGGQAEFCRETGIKTYDLSRILSGKKTVVYDDIYARLYSRVPELGDKPVIEQNKLSSLISSLGGSSDGRIERIKDAIMASNELTPEAKATAYRIITETK